MTAINVMEWSWEHQPGSSFRLDVTCFVVALALHAPLAFLTLDMKGKSLDRSKTERLVAVDIIDPDVETKPPPPPPPPEKKSIFDRIKNIVKKEPPPPPPPKATPKIEPKKLDLTPKQIKIEDKIKTAPTAAKIQSKEGFKTNIDPKLVQNKKSFLNTGTGVTPLTVKKLGVQKDRSQAIQGKSGFKIAKADKISSIGGDGPALAGGQSQIQINTAKKGSVEKFSQARIQPKANKGKFAGRLGDNNLDSGPKMGLKDSIIARDAQIGNIGRAGRVPSGGGTIATKQNAGRFEGGGTGRGPGVIGGTGTGSLKSRGTVGGSIKSTPVVQKKKGPLITGPLKDRPREREVLPEYPYWAQSQGIEATVVLGFRVTAQGIVKDNIEVLRTSGYHKLDMEAKKALLKWKWVPINENKEEVGQITFTFELS